MDLKLETFYKSMDKIVKKPVIDLSDVQFVYPWGILIICSPLIEFKNEKDKKIILPKNQNVVQYLKRIHFGEMLGKLGYSKEADIFNKIPAVEKENLNVQEICCSEYRDGFDNRLSYFLKMFSNFGLTEEDAQLVTSLLGELGNNSFDHNSGSWPTDISGCFFAAQNWPKKGKIEFAVYDPGIGFLGSLKTAFPELENDVNAIKKGLAGYTGRIGERRGNGLKFIQDSMIERFGGKLSIHSGKGFVSVSHNDQTEKAVNKILGTLAQVVIYYK